MAGRNVNICAVDARALPISTQLVVTSDATEEAEKLLDLWWFKNEQDPHAASLVAAVVFDPSQVPSTRLYDFHPIFGLQKRER
jgi:hypothetical protein